MEDRHRGIGLRRWRVAALLGGAAAMLWLPMEDSDVFWVLMFAGWIASLFAARLGLEPPLHPALRRLAAPQFLPALGLLAGLLVTPAALLLMAFKTGLHGHGAPDFTLDQIQTVVRGTPLFGLAGLLVGAGWGLFRYFEE